MSERVGLDPDLAAGMASVLSRGILLLDGIVDELMRTIRASADPLDRALDAGAPVIAPWSLPIAVAGLRHLGEAGRNALQLMRELGERVERQRFASSADDASYGLGWVSLARAGALYGAARRDPAVLEDLAPSAVASLFRALTTRQAEELLEAWPVQIGRLEGAPYALRDAANRATLQHALEEASLPADSPRRLAAERTAQALDDAAARGLGPVQLVVLDLPEDGAKTDMRAAISIGDLDRAEDIGVMVPGMNSNVEGSMRSLTWNAGNMQLDLRSPAFNRSEVPTAVVGWMGYESPTENPLDPDRFVGGDHLADAGGEQLNRFLGGIDVTNANARVTVLAHSYGTRLATYALSTGGRADALVMYGAPGVAEGIDTAVEIAGVGDGRVYSTKSAGDLLGSTGNVIDDAIRAGATGAWGNLGVDVLGEEMSDLDGRPNADPNDASFRAKVFATRDTPGHGLGEEGGSYSGYWGPPGTDSLDNGARIMLGLEPAA